jgi:hypothetical protein
MVRVMALDLDNAIPIIKDYPQYSTITDDNAFEILNDVFTDQPDAVDLILEDFVIAEDGKTAWCADNSNIVVRMWVE